MTSVVRRFRLSHLVALILLIGSSEQSLAQDADLTEQDYARAEQFLPWNFVKLVANTSVDPNWVGEGDRFWYRRQTPDGHEFILVDARRNRWEHAFDHVKLAAALSAATGQAYEAEQLPFVRFEIVDDGRGIDFDIGGERWSCDVEAYRCDAGSKPPQPQGHELLSPDGRWVTFVRDHNLYVRELDGADELRLTSDGMPYYDYGTRPEARQAPVTDRRFGIPQLPAARWSPDSKKLATHRTDQRGVAEQVLIQAAPPEADTPVVYRYRSPNPGDSIVPRGELMIYDVERGTTVRVDWPPVLAMFFSPFDLDQIWWSDDSQRLFIIAEERGWKAVRLLEVDVGSGTTRQILEERSPTFVELTVDYGSVPNVRLLGDGSEIIWFSERDGWGHLYLYNGETGALKRQITQGEWVVRQILRIDEAHGDLYFTASGREPGRDPYYRHLYRINLDGSGLELLTPEDADHDVRLSPNGQYFVDTYSRIDTTPVSVLRRTSDGRVMRTLEEADLTKLFETGWTWPERFVVKARDGVTDLYGAIFRPTNFDPSRKYPIIDDYYPGAQRHHVPKAFGPTLGGPQASAELGFIVVTLDGMGTAHRSKRFHDVSYRNFGDATLPDHITGLRQLAERYPHLDLDRVGIQGTSAGGYGSVRAMLAHPDFFKVAVSASGNAAMQSVIAIWAEKWQGYPIGDYYDESDNRKLAGNLKGKLLIAWGELDDTVPPYQTRQLIDALVSANKDFDLLVLPNRNHGAAGDPYFIRKRWDYFVQHLMGAKPPREYEIKMSR